MKLPEEIFSTLRLAPEEFTREMRLAAAIHWYHHGSRLETGTAARD
jgi:hypothetical protein